jgi:DNA repair exonuclease SbcCD ATPase subunit
MRIIPQIIRVRDFRSFNSEQVISLASAPGMLGLISGVNLMQPDLGANGTGKSTIWDALCWCLFGRTIRGLRGPSLLPWGVEVATPRVQFTFLKDGERYTISRTQNPNSVRLFRDAQGIGADCSGIAGEEIDQDSIHRLVGMDIELFKATVVRGQFADNFLDLTAKGKLNFLSKALDLDIWDEYAQKAAEERRELTARHEEAQRDVIRCVAEFNSLESHLMSLQRMRDKEKEDFDARYEAWQKEDARLNKEYDDLADAEEKSYDALDEAEKEVEGHLAKVRALRARFDEAKEAMQDQAVRLAGLEVRREAAETALSAAKSLDGDCPLCRTPVTADSRSEAITRAKAQLREASKALGAAEKTASDLKQRASEIKEQNTELRSEYEEKTAHATVLRKKYEGTVRARASAFSALEALTMPEDVSRIEEELRQATSDLRLAEANKNDTASLADSIGDRKQNADFWAKGFQDIRLWLLRNALDELEALANSHTLSLGLRGWRIYFDVERETKSGKIAKGFNCSIVSPTTEAPVPLESWSGGELQRLKIAVQAAMCDLIRSRFGGAFALEVWDEPGVHLSQRGVSDLMAFYRERAATLGIEIWLVDHRSQNSGEFDQQLVVSLTSDGTVVKRGHR